MMLLNNVFIQRFFTFFICFIKTRFLTFFILGVNVFYIYVSFPPTFTMMHLCITQYTYWTPLHIRSPCTNRSNPKNLISEMCHHQEASCDPHALLLTYLHT